VDFNPISRFVICSTTIDLVINAQGIIKGNDFDEDHLEIPHDIFKATFYDCEDGYIDIPPYQ